MVGGQDKIAKIYPHYVKIPIADDSGKLFSSAELDRRLGLMLELIVLVNMNPEKFTQDERGAYRFLHQSDPILDILLPNLFEESAMREILENCFYLVFSGSVLLAPGIPLIETKRSKSSQSKGGKSQYRYLLPKGLPLYEYVLIMEKIEKNIVIKFALPLVRGDFEDFLEKCACGCELKITRQKKAQGFVGERAFFSGKINISSIEIEIRSWEKGSALVFSADTWIESDCEKVLEWFGKFLKWKPFLVEFSSEPQFRPKLPSEYLKLLSSVDLIILFYRVVYADIAKKEFSDQIRSGNTAATLKEEDVLLVEWMEKEKSSFIQKYPSHPWIRLVHFFLLHIFHLFKEDLIKNNTRMGQDRIIEYSDSLKKIVGGLEKICDANPL